MLVTYTLCSILELALQTMQKETWEQRCRDKGHEQINNKNKQYPALMETSVSTYQVKSLIRMGRPSGKTLSEHQKDRVERL